VSQRWPDQQSLASGSIVAESNISSTAQRYCREHSPLLLPGPRPICGWGARSKQAVAALGLRVPSGHRRIGPGFH
jgi:hypothetical protein